MTPLVCDLLGHDWRFVAADRAGQGIRWLTWLCRRCPASIDTAAPRIPDAGGIFTRADVVMIAGLVLVAIATLLVGGRT